ncbi:MAG: two component LuxR family transcriptional regulator [Planctomycetota bacterium]|nr:MAG: two component LuxR family transcriptional regulator [Planctomycetota bacterium]
MPLIRIVLADDHKVVRAGIRAILEELSGVEIVGEAANGRETLSLVEEHQPDLLLVDITMPEMNGLEATARVVKEFPNVRVIMLSMHASEEYVWQALRAGAKGYLLKDTDAAELDQAIQAVLGGSTYLTSSVSKLVVDTYIERMRNHSNAADILTPRQREILQLIAEGKALKEIAHLLKLSVKTVETHRSMLMNRLDIHDTASLARYAIRVGMIPPEK